ncbi:hypothetical protein CaLGV027 [Clostera anastomosis granulovirus A]|uniref:Uncharacterized protein n=1 Tax=Clostera anastomosis granulovirus A TaxID=1986289 RepID=U5KB37_9BBAC|nr:hypothetical protein CaLGV027 [Clostera anastomosis granulovirus Henan]AGQ20286.1 hypothetical protein CaLGV027 [Clostera anastomosis granulovirus Henan]
MSSSALDLENVVQNLHKDIEIYRMAIDTLKREVEVLRQNCINVNEEWKQDQAKWVKLHNQHTEVITTLAEQLRKMDNESQEYNQIKTKSRELKRSVSKHTRVNSALRKKIRKLKLHIQSRNETLDDVICDGDALLEE